MPTKKLIGACLLIVLGVGVVSAQEDVLNPFSIEKDAQSMALKRSLSQ